MWWWCLRVCEASLSRSRAKLQVCMAIACTHTNITLLDNHLCPARSLIHTAINQSLVVVRFKFRALTCLPPAAAPASIFKSPVWGGGTPWLQSENTQSREQFEYETHSPHVTFNSCWRNWQKLLIVVEALREARGRGYLAATQLNGGGICDGTWK